MNRSLLIAIVLIFIIVTVATILGLYFGGVFNKSGSSTSPSNSPIIPTQGPINPTDPPPSKPTSSPVQPTISPVQPTSSPVQPTMGPPSDKCVNNPSGISPEGSYQIINPNVTVYRPKVACTPVTCLESYGGQCHADGSCSYPPGFEPLIDYPHAMATNYCDLESGGCSGALGDPRDFINNVKNCIVNGSAPETPPNGPVDENTRFGVTANPPIMIGDSAESYDLINQKQVTSSYQGSTPYSGICYDVKGPTGRAILVPYDRCAGYCKQGCGKTSANLKNQNDPTGNIECGSCLQSPAYKPKPNCPCVGKTPLDNKCCGKSEYGCGALDNQCDWCASQNHPHFDLDNDTFNTVCNGDAGALGSCELTTVKPFKCIVPQKMPSSNTGYVPCPTKSWDTAVPTSVPSCDSQKYIKPTDPAWPDSGDANHWCCVMGSGGGGYVPCPGKSWDTGEMGPGTCPSEGKIYKPGDHDWPDSSTANHWCCDRNITTKLNSTKKKSSSGSHCPQNSWGTGELGPGVEGLCLSGKYIKPGDSDWSDSVNANEWCCVSGPSKNEIETNYE
jgi:hypothetical protein